MTCFPADYKVPVLKKLVKALHPELATKNLKKSELLNYCAGRFVRGNGTTDNPYRLVSVAVLRRHR
jgi:hypothetical protein